MIETRAAKLGVKGKLGIHDAARKDLTTFDEVLREVLRHDMFDLAHVNQ